LASQSMTQALGYTWDQSAVSHDVPRFRVERAVWRFRRSLPEYVWDAAVLEGNPFTYPEVQTLLDGITVGGRKISDEQQVLNLAEAANELLRLVNAREFRLDKVISDRLQYLIARDEALESGHPSPTNAPPNSPRRYAATGTLTRDIYPERTVVLASGTCHQRRVRRSRLSPRRDSRTGRGRPRA
jgi:hypothetical protein